MRLVVFGLSVSSSWGNGHATLWRGLVRALHRRGHQVVFFERDEPYYAAHRDLDGMPGLELVLYASLEDVRARATDALRRADAAIVTSYCHDGPLASDLTLDSNAFVKCFYDLDTPVTLASMEAGKPVSYLPRGGLGDFDLVLSYTGGSALTLLESRLEARRTATLYGSVDPDQHRPTPELPDMAADLSYLGTYSDDRQAALKELLLAPAERLPERRFVIGGAQYPADFPWRRNTWFVRHLAPADHSAFYCSSPLTLNVTRAPMRELGYCPSARLFEAAACGVPVISDVWGGIGMFFEPGSEILLAHTQDDVIAALSLSTRELRSLGARARERALCEHTSDHRARELERHFQGVEHARHRHEARVRERNVS